MGTESSFRVPEQYDRTKCDQKGSQEMQGQGSAVKNWRALPLGGYPSIFGKNARAGQCSKKLASATAGGYPISLGKCKGRAVQ